MKKFLVALLTPLIFFILISTSFATWTITPATGFDKAVAWELNKGAWQAVYRIKLVCTSDGNAAAEFNLSDVITSDMLTRIRGGAFAQWMTEAGTVPASVDAVAISFDGDKGQDLTGATTTSLTTKPEEFKTTWIVWDLQITIGDIGDNLEQINLYLTFVK